MPDAVADTHALIWYLSDSVKLGPVGRAIFDDCDNGLASIHVPAVCLVEILYLEEKSRIPGGLRAGLSSILLSGTTNFVLANLTIGVVNAMATLPRTAVPDMPDRIIAGTALHLGLPLISRDGRIQVSNVRTVW